MSEMRGTISVLQNGTNISKSENHETGENRNVRSKDTVEWQERDL